MSLGWIAAPDDLRLRIADVVVAVSHRAVAQVLATPVTVVEWQMRAWWSVLLVPQKAPILRNR